MPRVGIAAIGLAAAASLAGCSDSSSCGEIVMMLDCDCTCPGGRTRTAPGRQCSTESFAEAWARCEAACLLGCPAGDAWGGDAEPVADGTADGPGDAAPDTAPDSALDTAPDAAPDTAPDAAFDAAPDTTPDVPPELPALPVGGCGMDAYSLVPRDQTGTIVSWEEDVQFQIPAETIDTLLAQYGWPHFSPVPYGARVFKVRYRTQDRGQVREATTVVGIPDPADGKARVFPTVLWLHGTTGLNDRCAPSRGMDGAAGAILMASIGYIGVAPDYLGLAGFGEPSEILHPYLVAEPTALAAWDAVRASRALLPQVQGGLAIPDARVIPWGASQGGHAALVVERYAPWFGPEFDVPAVLAVIPASDLVGLAAEGLKSAGETAATLTAFFAAAREWYGHPADLSGVLTDIEPKHFATAIPQMTRTDCGFGDLFDGVTSVDQVYASAFLAQVGTGIESIDPWGCYLSANSVPRMAVPHLRTPPTLYVQAQMDTLVLTAPEKASFDALCGQGYSLEYIECAGAGHVEGAVWSLPDQRAWLADRLAGKPLDPARVCVRGPARECTGKPL